MKRLYKYLPVFLAAGSIFFSCPVTAQERYERLVDEVGVLTQDEAQELQLLMDDIYETYDFESVVYVADSTEGMEVREYAAQFMQRYDYGGGESGRDALCVIHVPFQREFAVVARGKAQEIFDTDIQEEFLDIMEPYLKDDDFYSAYLTSQQAVERSMVRYAQGKAIRPMDVQGLSTVFVLARSFLISLIPSVLLAFLMGGVRRHQMKSIRPQEGARAYMSDGGLELLRKDDIYIRTEVRRVKREKNDGNKGGGSSGSFTSGGESFSGSSRSY
ncbi:MAG: TPM domain-containing protein [Eubacteriales bacterium]|nr:TPM domain-containing protein [Eubacteriales bacterium]